MPKKKVKGLRLWFSADRLKIVVSQTYPDKTPPEIADLINALSLEELTDIVFARASAVAPVMAAPVAAAYAIAPLETAPIEAPPTISTSIDDSELDDMFD